MPVDAEEREKLRERGVVRVAMRQWQDKPILGGLNLLTGETRYEQGEPVFTLLVPPAPSPAFPRVGEGHPLQPLGFPPKEPAVVFPLSVETQTPPHAIC